MKPNCRPGPAAAVFLSAALGLTPGLRAAAPALPTATNAAIAADRGRLTAIFKDLHENPELAFHEKRTAAIVAKELQASGFEVKTGIGKTGVVGILKNGDGPTVMYRADMDANAVEEATGLPYASRVKLGGEIPVAHLCGHDAHVTWMLGMAKAVAAAKADWGGTLVLVGQPAEERITGAQAMVDDGLYARRGVPAPDFLLGLHTAPGPVGMIASAGGVRMAGSDQLDVTFHGVGGHGSAPQLAKDPVVMAAAAVMQYQTIVSRLVDPQETAVLTVGAIEAGTDNNVIPSRALLKLSLRTFHPAVRARMVDAVRRISEGVAKSYGVADDQLPTLTMKGSCPPLVNDEALVERLNVPLRALLGAKNVVTDLPAITGSEDCPLLRGENTKVPIAFLFVGVADPGVFAAARAEGKPAPYSNHNPNFVVDLAAIPVGTQVATAIVLELLGKPARAPAPGP